MGKAVDRRRDEIVDFVVSKGSITFAQLKEAFPNASEMTLRTDLRALDQERRIVRIYGGARSVEEVVGTDGLLSDRSVRNVAAKELIAEKAATLVRPNTSIYLDSGSTTTAFAARMPDVPMLIFTNSLTVATELARLEKPQVVMVGGTLNRYSMSLAGGRAVDEVRRLSFDQVFLGVTSFGVSTGFSCGSDEEARLKRAVSERAHQVIALMDSSKASRRSTFSFCDLERADVLVSDGALPEKDLAALAAANVTVL